MSDPPSLQRDWYELGPDEQLALRESYGRHLDGLPPTCDLGTKIERCRGWLAERGIGYRHPD